MSGRRWPGVRFAVAFVLLGALSACRVGASDSPPAESGDTPEATSWRALGSWTGRGDRQTGSFDVTTGALRLAWEAYGDATEGQLRVTLHSAISGRPLQTLVTSTGSAADTVHVALGPRVAYLHIEADGVDWSLTLDEGVARALQEPHE